MGQSTRQGLDLSRTVVATRGQNGLSDRQAAQYDYVPQESPRYLYRSKSPGACVEPVKLGNCPRKQMHNR